ncbi:MAG: adenosylcobinamide-GDP ribazoletransferase [Lachnospiraceae bacterium]|nr:adenosylcobinamide-GDP ribazoletransferase [Lachnospiraceae bacterium]
MKKLINNCIVAFSMYSKIPMPMADWNKENMKYAMCFFPLIGLVIGALEFGWWNLMLWLDFGTIFRAAGMVLIPILVTGGIHLDGLLDTADALSSWRERERRLEILKDSHAGAFAVIIGLAFMTACIGGASEVTGEAVPSLCFSFAIARCLSALSVENFPNANPKGTAAAFGSNSYRRRVNLTMIVYLVLFCGAAILLQPVLGIVMTAAAFAAWGWYYRMAMKYFGGITGDLAGCFTCVSEMAMLLAVVIVNGIMRAL